MNGASGIGPAPDATAAPKATSRQGGEQPASGFEALLSQLRPGQGPMPATKEDARPGARAVAAADSGFLGSAGKPDPALAGGRRAREADASSGEARDRAVGVTRADTPPETAVAGVAPEFVTLDVAQGEAGLAQGVAGQITAALGGSRPDRAASADAAPVAQSGAGADRPGNAERSRAGAVVPGLGADAGGGPEPGRQAPAGLSVTRRETHFGPAGSGAGDRLPDRAVRDADGLGAGARRGDAPAATTASRRNPGYEPIVAAARPDASSEVASASTRRGFAPEAAALQSWRGIPLEALTGAPASATPGAAIGAPAGAAGLSGGSAGTVFEALPPLVRASLAHAVAGSGPAKVLHIRLQPAELGTLEVRMRVTDAGLEVHVEASRRETFALLQRDRDLLAGILRSAGHTLDGVTVSLADRTAGQPQMAAQDGWQPPLSDGRPEAQSGGTRERGGRADDRFPSRPEDGRANEQVQDDQDRPAVAARRHDSLYL